MLFIKVYLLAIFKISHSTTREPLFFQTTIKAFVKTDFLFQLMIYSTI